MILGWSEGFHDACATVLDDNGNIVFASHSERFSNKKHEKEICPRLKLYIDQHYNIDEYAFFEKPCLKKTRQLYAGQYKTVFKKRKLAWSPTKTFHHHLSHAAAAFQTSPYYEAAAVVVDSIGEWTTTSIWECKYDNKGNAKYKKVYNVNYPSSIGLWYTALTKYVGLKPLDEEYIFMGMAAYGAYKPFLTQQLHDLLNSDINLHKGINSDIANKYHLTSFSPETISRNAQVVLQRKLSDLFQIALSYSSNVVYGGGVALNCVANSQLHNMCNGNLWIMPNPGDAGGSLGAAALAYGKKVNWIDPYLGLNIEPTKPRKKLVEEIVDHLLKEKMCGVAHGKAEFGPRALGNRSLIADPRGDSIKDKVNEIKRRQKFRPFAPAVLSEHADKVFYKPYGEYMQLVTQVKREWKDSIPAVQHADGSARVQVVRPEDNTIFRDILELWYKKTGCPVLLNTSLNIRGEPMVNDINDAKRFQGLYKVKVFF